MKVEIDVDIAEAQQMLRGLEHQIPYATAVALTRTAQAADVAIKQEMVRVFDRPTPFTLNATRVTPATKSRLEASVFFKDLGSTGGGDAKTRYAPQVFGGQRVFKRFEAMLWRAGLLAQSENAVPGDAAKRDAYGNMQRSQILQILSWFETFGEEGYRANSTKTTRAKRAAGTRNRYGQRYFLKRDKPGRGIYEATKTGFGSSIRPVLMFVQRASYRPRLDVPAIVQRTTEQQLRRWFADAVAEARRTAR